LHSPLVDLSRVEANLPDIPYNKTIFLHIPSHLRGGSRSSRTRGGMRWLRTVFDARAIDRARSSNVQCLFVAWADGHIVFGRPKSRYPGASPCAKFFKRFGATPTLSPRKRKSGVIPSSGDGPKGRSPGGFAKQAVRTIAYRSHACADFVNSSAIRRMMRRDRGDTTRVLFTFAHEAADAFAHPAFRAPSHCESAGFMLPGIGQAQRPERTPRAQNAPRECGRASPMYVAI
jgi:hypothetical protein